MAISGLKTHTLEIKARLGVFDAHGKDSKGNGPNLFKRYSRSEICAEDKIKHGVNLIDEVENDAKGTAYYFRHPIWQALDYKQLSIDVINQTLYGFPHTLRKLLFSEGEEDKRNGIPRKLPFTDETAEEIVKAGDFNSLAVAMFLVQEAEVISSAELRTMATAIYHELQPEIAKTTGLETAYPVLFSYIDQRVADWLFVYPNERLNVLITWQGMKEHCWDNND